jgi:hypothetical protein
MFVPAPMSNRQPCPAERRRRSQPGWIWTMASIAVGGSAMEPSSSALLMQKPRGSPRYLKLGVMGLAASAAGDLKPMRWMARHRLDAPWRSR